MSYLGSLNSACPLLTPKSTFEVVGQDMEPVCVCVCVQSGLPSRPKEF